jgi:hypothetical protein
MVTFGQHRGGCHTAGVAADVIDRYLSGGAELVAMTS